MSKERILVVDDDRAHAEVIQVVLQRSGYVVEVADHFQAALDRVRARDFAVVITDLRLGDGSGLDLLRDIQQRTPEVGVFVMTGYGSVETAVLAMEEGAISYINKPIDARELKARVDRQIEAQRLKHDNQSLHQTLDERFGMDGMVGQSSAMKPVYDRVRQVGPTDATVLVSGESGTGKELVAQSLHNVSKRAKRKFVAVNCAALSESLIESELFGYVKGAFTGANDSKIGKFEYADGGTLFLDEVGEMPLDTQSKLLRVLEEKKVLPVGGNEARAVDVRIVTATNRALEEMVKEGEFREDLYYRLNVITISLPSLRERKEDIPLLADYFLADISSRENKESPEVSSEVLQKLIEYAWPGNVRELKNAMESMVLLNKSGVLSLLDLPPFLANLESDKETIVVHSTPQLVDEQVAIEHLVGKSLSEVENMFIKATLKASSGNRRKAAKQLGIGERTLYRKLSNEN